jgi:TatA/E family protein of Tat protein translocase
MQGVAGMFGIGMPELVIIFVIALLVFGPKELPKIGKTIGRAMGEFRRASDELKDGIQREIDMVEREQSEVTPSSDVSVETVPAEPPVAVAEPAPEPQLELPMAGVPLATAPAAGYSDIQPAAEPIGAPKDTPLAAADASDGIPEGVSTPKATETHASAPPATSTVTSAPTPPEPKHV